MTWPPNEAACFRRLGRLRFQMMRFGALLTIGTTLAVLGALAFGELLGRLYPDGGISVFLAYYAVHVCACVAAWALALRLADV